MTYPGNKIEFEVEGMKGVYVFQQNSPLTYRGDAVLETPDGKFTTPVLLSWALIEYCQTELIKKVLADLVLSRYKKAKDDRQAV